MAEKRKFTTEMRAAKVASRMGWTHRTDAEAAAIAHAPVVFRKLDSGNIARIATALERIAGYLKRIADAEETRNRTDHERVTNG